MASASIIGVIASSTKPNSGGGGGYGTITGYYNSNLDSARFCANIGPNQAITVYYSGSGTKTFQQASFSGSTIFSDTALTTSASAGYYGTQNGGSGNRYYGWRTSGGAWDDSGICS